jgi:hypothetical protein
MSKEPMKSARPVKPGFSQVSPQKLNIGGPRCIRASFSNASRYELAVHSAQSQTDQTHDIQTMKLNKAKEGMRRRRIPIFTVHSAQSQTGQTHDIQTMKLNKAKEGMSRRRIPIYV